MTIWTLAFWRATTERALKTIAQTAAALLVAGGTGLLDTSWVSILSVAGMAGLVSVLTSVGSDALTGTGPSLTDAEVVAGEVPLDRVARRRRDHLGRSTLETVLVVLVVIALVLGVAAVIVR